MATILAQKLAQAQEANDAVRNFMRRFEVGKLLRVCRASKSKGFSVVELFRFLLCCMFSQSSMLSSAMKAGHKAQYVLFDSWFATPKGITDIKKKTGLDVLAMLKKSGKVFYEYGDQQLDLKEIYALNRKRPGRAKYLLSVEANLIQKDKGQVVSRLPVRIVFVRNRNKRKDWIALISTDMEIPEEEIIRRYGVRWNIEVYFKTCKQQLPLHRGSENGCQRCRLGYSNAAS